MHFTLILHIDDVQCSASCWLQIISRITIVIKPINSSANLRHHYFDWGGDRRRGGEESLFVSSRTAVVANWQINLLFCLRS